MTFEISLLAVYASKLMHFDFVEILSTNAVKVCILNR